MHASTWIGLCAAAASMLCACKTSPAKDSRPSSCTLVPSGFGPAGTTALQIDVVASGLEVPWGIAFLPGGDWLVTERPGRVRLLRAGQLQPTPVARVQVASGDEGGLLGVAVDPSFESSRFFYVYATMPAASGTVNQVLRLRMSEDHSSAVVDRVLVDGIDAAKYHDGGRIRIGPDGLLYVGTGDARVPQRAQQAGSLNGKILRYRLDGSVPPDNPSAGSAVYVSGLRNTQGFDWLDARTLVVVDHGPSGDLGKRGLDEVHVARAGDNLGWPEVTGCDAAPGKASPLLSWKMAVPPGGAALYRGTSLAAWKDNLIIGTLGSRHLHRVVLDKSGRRVERHEVYLQGDPPAGYGRLREVVMGPDGHLYVTTSNCDGRGQCPPDKDKLLRVRAP